MFKTVLENMKKEIDAVLSQFVEIEELKKDEGETIVDEPMSNEEDLSGLLAFYRITVENWGDMLEETKIILRSLYTERSKVYKDKDPAEMAGGEQPPQDTELINDENEDECDDCDDEDKTNEPTEKDDAPEDDTKPPVEKKEFIATKSVEELLRRQR